MFNFGIFSLGGRACKTNGFGVVPEETSDKTATKGRREERER